MPSIVNQRAARTVRSGWRASVAILASGLVWMLVEREPLPDRMGSPADVLQGLVDGEAASLVGLGVLAVILTPIVAAMVIAVSYLQTGDRRYAAISGLVLAILIASIAMSLV